MNLQLNKVAKHYTGNLYRELDRRNRLMVIGGIIAFITAIVLIIVFMPSGKEVQSYKGSIGLVVNGNIINTNSSPMVSGSTVFLSLTDIKDYIDKNIFFDSAAKKVIITTQNRVIRLEVDKNTGLSNNRVLALNGNVRMVDGAVYMPIEAFEDIYNIDVRYIKDNNVVVVDQLDKDMRKGTIKKDDKAIRQMPSIKEPIVKRSTKGETVRIFGENQENWYKVRASNGTVGFIQKKYVINETRETAKNTNQAQSVVWKPTNGKINLVWDQIERVTPAMDNVDKAEGLDVIVPTWFELVGGNGQIKNKAESAYVRWAHANGYKVWGLVHNRFENDTTKIALSNSDSRENAINELLRLSEQYDLDGINVNFELDGTKVSENIVKKEYRNQLTQFMRELAPLFREKGMTVSIAVTVKAVASPNSTFFDRKALGEAVDYVTLMSYDQFWSTSPVAGPVAQYSWVEKNIQSTLKEVPKEKLIMGIPFYSRQWKEVPGKTRPESNSLSMASVQNLIRQYSAKVSWDEASGQNYTEFMKGDAKIRIWVEDAKSIDLKSSLSLKYDLAGTASWRRGYESPGVWGVLKKNLKDYKTYGEWQRNFKK